MPSRVRRYSGRETVLIHCSFCGSRFEYPDEIRQGSDKLWRCYRDDKGTNRLDEERAVASSRKRRDEPAPRLPFPSKGIGS